MLVSTSYENMIIDLLRDGVPHGWGKIEIEWYTKGDITTLTIDFGKKYIFKIEKDFKFEDNIL